MDSFALFCTRSECKHGSSAAFRRSWTIWSPLLRWQCTCLLSFSWCVGHYLRFLICKEQEKVSTNGTFTTKEEVGAPVWRTAMDVLRANLAVPKNMVPQYHYLGAILVTIPKLIRWCGTGTKSSLSTVMVVLSPATTWRFVLSPWLLTTPGHRLWRSQALF